MENREKMKLHNTEISITESKLCDNILRHNGKEGNVKS